MNIPPFINSFSFFPAGGEESTIGGKGGWRCLKRFSNKYVYTLFLYLCVGISCLNVLLTVERVFFLSPERERYGNSAEMISGGF